MRARTKSGSSSSFFILFSSFSSSFSLNAFPNQESRRTGLPSQRVCSLFLSSLTLCPSSNLLPLGLTRASSHATKTQSQRVHCLDRRPCQVTSRAEMCTPIHVQYIHFTPQNIEQLTQIIPQGAALARGLSHLASMRPRPRQPCLLGYAARSDVPNYVRLQSAPYPIRVRTTRLVPRILDSAAGVSLVTWHRCAPIPDCNSYKVMQCAVTCSTARGHDSHPTSLSQEQLTLAALLHKARRTCD